LDSQWDWPDQLGDNNYPTIKESINGNISRKMLLLGANDPVYTSFRSASIEVFTLE
jgi:hypothetical protein